MSRDRTMALLVLDEVSKLSSGGRGGPRQRPALRDVSFELDASEFVAVWGLPRSGRSTLLHVAGGVMPPSAGVVRFDGRDLAATPALGRPAGIALVNTCFRRVIGDSVLEHVAAPFMGRGMPVLPAQSKALQLLRRVDAVACAELDANDLDHAEAIRVGIARALATSPRLLLLDEPTIGVPPARDRDDVLALLRSISRRDRVAILMTVGEAADLAGVDRALTIDDGTLRGPLRPEPARVIELRPEQSGSTA
ncbi:MAG: ATP-binding cassette domain-containing protein [Actinobacteria bacterium]|nr:ATP-binding cassette domain-containing protein [Actinomycetota bacterium]